MNDNFEIKLNNCMIDKLRIEHIILLFEIFINHKFSFAKALVTVSLYMSKLSRMHNIPLLKNKN